MTETLPPPAPQPPEARPPVTMGGLAELDQRVLEAERRLVAREAALHHRVRCLRQRARGEPRRLLGPVAVTVAALAGLLWWRRSRRRPGAPGTAAAAQSGGADWMRYVGLAWPLLPARWQSRVSPAAAVALVSLVAPLLARVFRRR